jgi:hypothetical protein
MHLLEYLLNLHYFASKLSVKLKSVNEEPKEEDHPMQTV